MHSVSSQDHSATMTRGHRFVVNMMMQEDGTVEVRSCEVIGTFHRNRFTFPQAITVDDVFVAEIAKGVTACLASLSHTTEVVSLPSMTIETPGLSLARAHLITTKGNDGSLSIILRFKMLLGAVTQAFQPQLGIEDSVPDHASHLSAMVLTDIVMPLLDLCTAAEEGSLTSSSGFDRFIDTLTERSNDVRFQAELIKRFVATAPGSERPASRPAGIEHNDNQILTST